MSKAALAPRPSALVSVPTRSELEALGPGDRWTLEERLGDVQILLREFNDNELRQWVEVDGKTQGEVAKLVGRSQSRIQERCAALGLVSKSNRGRPRITGTGNSDEEVIDAEVVEDDPQPRPTPRPAAAGPAHAPTASEPSPPPADPGPRVQCPTCGHMVKPDDIGAWQ